MAAAAAAGGGGSGAGAVACFACEPGVSGRGLTGAGELVETVVRLALALDEGATVTGPSGGGGGSGWGRCTVSVS